MKSAKVFLESGYHLAKPKIEKLDVNVVKELCKKRIELLKNAQIKRELTEKEHQSLDETLAQASESRKNFSAY